MISAEGNVTIAANVVVGTVGVNEPIVTQQARIGATVVAVVTTIGSPVISCGAVIVPASVATLAQIPDPAIEIALYRIRTTASTSTRMATSTSSSGRKVARAGLLSP